MGLFSIIRLFTTLVSQVLAVFALLNPWSKVWMVAVETKSEQQVPVIVSYVTASCGSLVDVAFRIWFSVLSTC